MSVYDIQKAFYSVETPVLLYIARLHEAWIKSKTWHLCSTVTYYRECKSSVQLGPSVSAQFSLEQGVRQGSSSLMHCFY